MYHLIIRRKPLNYFRHERVVHSIALNYECNSLFATACDDGKIRVFDTRQPCTAGLFPLYLLNN